MNKKMMKRLLSMLMVLIMVFSMVPVHTFAADGEGTAEKPWQVNDEVTVDGSGEPVGNIAENTKWQFISKTEGDCTVEEHAHGETCEKVYDHAAHSHTFDAVCTLVCSGIHVCTEECAEDCALKHEAHVAACCSKTEHAHVEGECVKACPKTVHNHEDGNCQKPVLTTTWKLVEKPAVCDVTGCTKGKDHEGKHDVCTKGEDCKDGVHVEGCDLYVISCGGKAESEGECKAETHVASCYKYVSPNCETCGLTAHEGDCACTGEENCPAQETHNEGCIKGQPQSNPCEEGACDHVAVVGEDHFETLAAALDEENAVEGQLAIRLLKSVSVEDPIAVAAGLTVTITYEAPVELNGTQLFILGEGATVTINGTAYDPTPDAMVIPEECTCSYKCVKEGNRVTKKACPVCGATGADLDDCQATAVPSKPTEYVEFYEREGITLGAQFVSMVPGADASEEEKAAYEAKMAYYGDWEVDFAVSVNQTVTFTEEETCELWGCIWGFNRVFATFNAGAFPANTPFGVLRSAYRFSLSDINEQVGEFACGLILSDEFLANPANKDLRITLELRLYEPDSAYDPATNPGTSITTSLAYPVSGIAVAKLESNEKVYSNVQAAIDAAQATDTIVLLENFNSAKTAPLSVPSGKNITLNLNNKKLTISSISNAGTLTISNGTLVGTDKANSVIETTGSLTLTNVTASGPRHVIKVESGSATINSGTYTATGQSNTTTHALNAEAGTVTILGGTFVGPDGTASDSGSAVMVQSGAKVTIQNGRFEKGKGDLLISTGTLEITGGSFVGFNPDDVAHDFVPDTHGVVESGTTEKTYAVHAHNWNTTEWAYDEDGHYHGCNFTGCTYRKDEAAHAAKSGEVANCKAKLKCETCGHEYGDFAAHTLTRQDAIDAGLTTKGYGEHYLCSVCGKRFTDETATQEATEIPALVTVSNGVATISAGAVTKLTTNGNLLIDLTDEDVVGEGNTGIAAAKIPTASMLAMDGTVTVITGAGEVKLNKAAVAAVAAEANCSEVTVSLQEITDASLSDAQKKALKTKTLKDQKIVRVRILDCDGDELFTKETGEAKVTLNVTNDLKTGIGSSRYKVYWITDKLTEVSRSHLGSGEFKISLDHLSDYVIAYIPKNASNAATGDDSNVFVWAGVGLAALVVLGGVLIIGRKKKR